MTDKAWRTYRHRWKTFYRDRLDTGEWVRAGFAMPFIPRYYSWLVRFLSRQALSGLKRSVKVRA
jgi:hypothetical protein